MIYHYCWSTCVFHALILVNILESCCIDKQTYKIFRMHHYKILFKIELNANKHEIEMLLNTDSKGSSITQMALFFTVCCCSWSSLVDESFHGKFCETFHKYNLKIASKVLIIITFAKSSVFKKSNKNGQSDLTEQRNK